MKRKIISILTIVTMLAAYPTALAEEYIADFEVTAAEIEAVINGNTPEEPTTINVVKTSTDTKWQFNVALNKPVADIYIYAVVYGAHGNMTGINCIPVESFGSTVVDVAKTGADKTAKIFVWNGRQQPITRPVELEL
ncbi:MAG: hypothetical protein IJH94_06320 [Clostridia bacterium]|nr:hypothetical protein [Clostridia bacterium]